MEVCFLLVDVIAPFSLIDADLDGFDVGNIFQHFLVDADVFSMPILYKIWWTPFSMLMPTWMVMPALIVVVDHVVDRLLSFDVAEAVTYMYTLMSIFCCDGSMSLMFWPCL